MRKKKFKVIEIGGIRGAVVSSWEEEQGARKQGFINFYFLEKKRRKKKEPKRYIRYSADGGIFQLD
jgi:hypothetical protein